MVSISIYNSIQFPVRAMSENPNQAVRRRFRRYIYFRLQKNFPKCALSEFSNMIFRNHIKLYLVKQDPRPEFHQLSK